MSQDNDPLDSQELEDEHLRVFSIEEGDEDLDAELEDDVQLASRPPVADVLTALSSGTVRPADLIGLSDLSRADSVLVATAWPTLDPSVRQSVVTEVRETAEERFEYNFGRLHRIALEDELPQIRQLAIAGLWEDEGEDLPDLLLDLLDTDDSVDVRAQAAGALMPSAELADLDELPSELGERIRERLFTLAADHEEDWHVRAKALESASAFSGDSRLVGLIQDFYDEDELGLRSTAVFAMGRSFDPRWLPTVIDEFENDDPEIRHEAARAAGNLSDVTALPGLSELAKDDEDAEVRQAAIASVGTIGGPGAIRILERLSEMAPESDTEAIDDALIEANLTADPFATSD